MAKQSSSPFNVNIQEAIATVDVSSPARAKQDLQQLARENGWDIEGFILNGELEVIVFEQAGRKPIVSLKVYP